MPSWLPDCLPATYPPYDCVHSERFGIPQGAYGRCAGGQINGVVIHCIEQAASSYVAEACALPRYWRQRGRRHHDSLHWLVTQNGDLISIVPEEDVAWGFGDVAPDNCLPPASTTWPPLAGVAQADFDCVLLHVGVELPMSTATYGDCGECDCNRPTPYPGVNRILPRLLAAIARRYNWPLDRTRFELHTNLATCAEECLCLDVDKLLCAARNYCERPRVFTAEEYPLLPIGETLEYVIGISNTGRIVRVPRSAI